MKKLLIFALAPFVIALTLIAVILSAIKHLGELLLIIFLKIIFIPYTWIGGFISWFTLATIQNPLIFFIGVPFTTGFLMFFIDVPFTGALIIALFPFILLNIETFKEIPNMRRSAIAVSYDSIGEYEKSFSIRKDLAEKGNASGQYYLALHYIDGLVVPKDNAEAIKWLRQSAKQGDIPAIAKLGSIYYEGELIPKDNIKSYMLNFIIKDTDENQSAIVRKGLNRDIKEAIKTAKSHITHLEETMPLSDIEEAKAMAKRYTESDYKDCGLDI